MAGRRDLIKMSEQEAVDFLLEQRVAVVSTNGPRGWPHSMPLWYVVRDGELWSWTYRKSQKVKNLERDPRATVLVEAGDEYQELRGVMIEAEVEMHTDPEVVVPFAEELTARYTEGIDEIGEDARRAMVAQAPKRLVMRFVSRRTATWDHRKLGGGY